MPKRGGLYKFTVFHVIEIKHREIRLGESTVQLPKRRSGLAWRKTKKQR